MDQNETMIKPIRNSGLDVIRTFAILFIIAGHFFSLHTAFKSSIFEGFSIFIQAFVSFLFQTGVPLFLLLTGYLNANRGISRKYYKGIFKVITPYLFFSLIAVVFRKYYLLENFSWTQLFLKILDFSTIPYAWYIEMWIGLFFLLPFLNILYKGIQTKRHKQLLIFTLFVLTAFPSTFNRYGMYLIPAFWQSIFPLTFYFIGSYIQEYQPHVNKKILIGIICGICLINPLFNLLFVKEHTMIHIAGDANGIFGTILAVLFFLLCYRIKVKQKPINKIITQVSLYSLDMYLCRYLFDSIYYPYFKENYFISQSQFGIYFFVIVPLVFISSFIMAWLRDLLFSVFEK